MDAVLNWVWQGVVVAAALFLMLRAIEGAHANVRYIVCSLALLIVLTIPALWSLSSTSDVPQYAAQSSVGPVVPVPATPWTSTAAMLGLWFLWASSQGLRVSRALIGLRRARQTCRPFPTDVEPRLRHWMRVRGEQRPARLVVNDGVGRAAVLGCGTPIIAVAPALLERLSADELDYVIIHEWAHVQRRDDLANLLQLGIRVVAGWHPAVWWIDRRLQVEREVACDETAVAVTGSAKSYATCLVKLTDLSAVTPVSLAAPGAVTAGSLRYRVTRIVSERPFSSPIWSRGLGTAVVAALLTLAAGIGSFELFATVMTPQTSAKTMTISAPLEPIPTRRLNMNPVPKAQETRTKSAVAPRRDMPGAPRGLFQTTEISPVEVSSLWPPIVQSHEGGDQQAQVETREAVAADASTVAGDAAIPDAVAPPASDPQADSRSPWVAAADAGVSIGRRSRAAGVATAGVFTRFARRIAGSF
jgi:beta-lactamase regulating signal transducer with metallopeptidase domain